MPTTTLYLIRHGEAERTPRTNDPGLTERGRRQSAAVGERLSGAKVEAIYHSTARRASKTAAVIAQWLPGAATIHSGHVDDRTPVPTDLDTSPHRYHAYLGRVPSDERDVDAQALEQAVEALGRVGDQDRVVIAVTHNFVIGWFVRDALDAPAWRWIGLNQHNCAITIIQYDSSPETRLLAFNDCGHLKL